MLRQAMVIMCFLFIELAYQDTVWDNYDANIAFHSITK